MPTLFSGGGYLFFDQKILRLAKKYLSLRVIRFYMLSYGS
jgi:hypothetical protein